VSFFLSIPTWGWFDIGFTLIVLVALAGESDWTVKRLIADKPNELLPPEWKRKRLKRKFEFLLIFGIAGELACLPFSLVDSATTNKLAGEANERAANAELKVKQLRKENELLKIRRITKNQNDAFVNFLKNYPKGNVKVIIGLVDSETETYAYQIRQMLDEAGYGDGKSGEIIRLENALRINSDILDPMQNSGSDFYFAWFGDSKDKINPKYYLMRRTNGVVYAVFDPTCGRFSRAAEGGGFIPSEHGL
jgi:hypothetical protein